jgi:glycosyltransferase involved in cell wall biosynthesis
MIYRLARSFYRQVKILIKPIVLRHPRLHRFLRSVKDAARDFLHPEATESQGMLLSSMEAVSVSSKSALDEPKGEFRVPQWLLDEWKEVHAIEPQLFPETSIPVNVVTDFISESQVGKHYLDLCSQYGTDVSHVFLVPWLKKGGADLVTLNYTKALAQVGHRGIVVISTENEESPWAEKLSPSVRFIEFGRRYSHLSQKEQGTLLTRVLLQMAPRVIHTINSLLGYRIFIQYGKALADVSRLYACAFCEDITREGRSIGYPICFLPGCFDSLTAVFSDNEYMVNRLCELFAFERERFHVHYQPVDIAWRKERRRSDQGKEHLDVLWASRLDVQKRPDILIKIAERSRDLPVRFHVYGTPVYGTSEREVETYIKSLNALPNAKYHGPFDGLPSLPVQNYDVYLYTSQWDGLPNTLLEAVSLGLPVIASAVGGIPELIQERKTGFLVRPYDHVDGYVDILRMIEADPLVLKGMVEKSLELIHAHHSWGHFLETLERIPFYCRTEVSV